MEKSAQARLARWDADVKGAIAVIVTAGRMGIQVDPGEALLDGINARWAALSREEEDHLGKLQQIRHRQAYCAEASRASSGV